MFCSPLYYRYGKFANIVYHLNQLHRYVLVLYLTNSSKILKTYDRWKNWIMHRVLKIWVCWYCCCTVKKIDMADFDKSYNPNHLDNILIKNIDKCYCEPYNKDHFGPSIVRFPVRISQYYIHLWLYNLQSYK